MPAWATPSQVPPPPPYSGHALSCPEDLRLARRAARRHGRSHRLAGDGLSQTGLPLGADRRPPGLRRVAAAADAGASAGDRRRRRPSSCRTARPRPEKSEGGVPLDIQSELEPKGDQPPAIAELVAQVERAGARPGAARRHRLGQDLHHGEGDRGDAAPGAGARAQQDARRPALWRVQELLPRERGRVFRLLLRLLPARGLYPAHRHLYREGILDQRADRPHAPRGDPRAGRARRRDHRGVACPASTVSARSRPIPR